MDSSTKVILNRLSAASLTFFLAAFIAMPLMKYHALHTNIADLGFFIANFSSVQFEWQRSFFGHVQPLTYLIGAVLTLLPGELWPYAILLEQSIILLISIGLIWKYYGWIAGVAMFFYAPVWYNNLFDYHFDHISIIILTFFFINCKKKNYISASLVSLLLCFVKEIYSLQAVFCGIYLFYLTISDRQINLKNTIIFISVMVFSGAWFFISLKYVIPFFSGINFSDIGGGAINNGEIGSLWRLDIILMEIFQNSGKMKYLFILFGSLLFIPLISPLALVVAMPIIGISLLSNNANYYDYASHYTAGIIVPIIICFSSGINYLIFKCKKINFKFRIELKFVIISLILLLSIIFSPIPFSRLFLSNKVWAYGYSAYITTDRDSKIKDALLKFIPPDKSISVSSINTLNYFRISERKFIPPFPIGVVDSLDFIKMNDKTFTKLVKNIINNEDYINEYYNIKIDYVVIDRKRPIYFGDKGCGWSYGKCTDELIVSKYDSSIQLMMKNYEVIYNADDFIITRKLK